MTPVSGGCETRCCRVKDKHKDKNKDKDKEPAGRRRYENHGEALALR